MLGEHGIGPAPRASAVGTVALAEELWDHREDRRARHAEQPLAHDARGTHHQRRPAGRVETTAAR
jgi:hypothetical protein